MAPAVMASLTVPSAQPSATTMVAVASPHTCSGSASITGPMAPSSLYAAMTIATGGRPVARSP